MPVDTEPRILPRLTTRREPEGVVRAGDPGSIGDKALIDALIIVLVSWAVLFFLVLSLRNHNI